MATTGNWKEIIRTNYPNLMTDIDCEHELQGELRRRGIFAPIEFRTILEHTDTTRRIDAMLKSLERKDFASFVSFCEALTDSYQSHIIKNHLSSVRDTSSQQTTTADSAVVVDPSQTRPISPEMKRCLEQNWNALRLNITLDTTFLAELGRLGSFTTLVLRKLKDIDKETERTHFMLNILEKGNEKQFLDFCSALRTCNQQHVVCEFLTPRATTQEIPIVNGQTSEADPIPRENSPPVEPTQRPPDVVPSQELRRRKTEDTTNDAYKCESKPRGRALIFSNEYFKKENLTWREGTKKDASDLQQLFSLLHFTPVVHQDKTAEEIMKILHKEREDNENFHSKCDMFVLFFMSHGIRGEIYDIDGIPIKTERILELFDGNNCPNLNGKPKMIFIQACQGHKRTTGVPVNHRNMTVSDSEENHFYSINDLDVLDILSGIEDIELSLPLTRDDLIPYQSDAVPSLETIHEKADMLLTYATVEGQVAWRNRETGSHFVQTLINVFKEHAHEEDVLSMMTRVTRLVHDKEVTINGNTYKQMAVKRDTLRYKVYLKP